MLYYRKTHSNRVLWAVFLSCMLLAVGIFGHRVYAGNIQSEMTSGQIIKVAEQYIMGRVFDRNGNMIVQGTEQGAQWRDEKTERLFSDLMGIDIEKTVNSPFTVAGNCAWLFGTEDNRFGLKDLIDPGQERVGGSVVLTLDMELQSYIDQVLSQYGFEHATVMVSDYSTGEILAAYGNVFVDMYHPGSTIKPILAAAILNLYPEMKNYTYECVKENHDFYTEQGWYHIDCAYEKEHGLVDMEKAIAQSCNGYFVSLLQQIPRKELQKELEKWGFDTVIAYEQFSYWDQTFLKDSDRETDYLLAAIGQANAYTTVAGMHFCTNALLNGGTFNEPLLLKMKLSEPEGEWQKIASDKTYQMCSAEVADTVEMMMESVTTWGIGTRFYYPEFAAKTGTAQKADKEGSILNEYTVWTTGGLTNENTPYSVTVCLDQVSEEIDSTWAGLVARDILDYLAKEDLNG